MSDLCFTTQTRKHLTTQDKQVRRQHVTLSHPSLRCDQPFVGSIDYEGVCHHCDALHNLGPIVHQLAWKKHAEKPSGPGALSGLMEKRALLISSVVGIQD